MPPGIDLTAYRVLQEALTNALKYAPGAETHVDVVYEDQALGLDVVNDRSSNGSNGVATGAGRGLIGMRQRVAVYGGELSSGPTPNGGFAVHARLPLA